MGNAKPTRERATISWRPAHLDLPRLHRLRQIHLPETHASERDDGSLDLESHLVTGILDAEIDLGAMQNEPVESIVDSPKSEHQDDTLRRQGVDAHQSSQRPHQKVGIEVLGFEVLACPIVAPCSEGLDHRAERTTGDRQAIRVPMFTLGVDLLDDSTAAQRLQSLREKIPRDSRDAAVEIGEATFADQQLAQDKRRPTLGEDLGAKRNGTELPIAGHDSNVRSPRPRCKFVL